MSTEYYVLIAEKRRCHAERLAFLACLTDKHRAELNCRLGEAISVHPGLSRGVSHRPHFEDDEAELPRSRCAV